MRSIHRPVLRLPPQSQTDSRVVWRFNPPDAQWFQHAVCATRASNYDCMRLKAGLKIESTRAGTRTDFKPGKYRENQAACPAQVNRLNTNHKEWNKNTGIWNFK